MRKFVCYAFINLVSFILGQSGICLGHRELTLVLVGREFRPLTIKIQRVALATEIRVLQKRIGYTKRFDLLQTGSSNGNGSDIKG